MKIKNPWFWLAVAVMIAVTIQTALADGSCA
jgi:hypothetical protein